MYIIQGYNLSDILFYVTNI